MKINLTNEQIERLGEELLKDGIPEDMISLLTSNISLLTSNINVNTPSRFSHITIPEIEEKISNFQKIDTKNISDDELGTAIFDVMNINVDGTNIHVFFPFFETLSKGKRLYRVRTLPSDDEGLKQFSYIEAYWNPPTEVIKSSGRLNKAHESLLYTSLDMNTPLSEIKIKENQPFALIVYEAAEPIKTVVIGASNDISELSEEDNKKFQKYNRFLTEEFSREVQPGSEYLYRVSEFIAKSYFDYPPRDVQDAWIYPSVAANGKYNVCFRPEIAKELLRFVGTIICTIIENNGEPLFNCLLIGIPDTDDIIQFYQATENKMKELFKEFVSAKGYSAPN